jgi:hypothetical protein
MEEFRKDSDMLREQFKDLTEEMEKLPRKSLVASLMRQPKARQLFCHQGGDARVFRKGEERRNFDE